MLTWGTKSSRPVTFNMINSTWQLSFSLHGAKKNWSYSQRKGYHWFHSLGWGDFLQFHTKMSLQSLRTKWTSVSFYEW